MGCDFRPGNALLTRTVDGVGGFCRVEYAGISVEEARHENAN